MKIIFKNLNDKELKKIDRHMPINALGRTHVYFRNSKDLIWPVKLCRRFAFEERLGLIFLYKTWQITIQIPNEPGVYFH
jgi:hypothetical protein